MRIDRRVLAAGPRYLRAAALALLWMAAGPAHGQTSSVTISNTSLPDGSTGVAYSVTLTAVGGSAPYTWSITGTLPTGLTLDGTTGILSGTPSNIGTFNVTVQVSDTRQLSASKALTLVVKAGPLTITTQAPLFNGTVQSPYSQPFSASGGTPPYQWSILSGSAGNLTLGASTGILQGTPQTAGTLNFTLQVSDNSGAKSSKAFSITIAPLSLTILTGSPLPNGTVGAAYSQQFAISGGTAPYSWVLLSGAVPGLTFSTSGNLTGTPTTPGSYTLTIQGEDSKGVTGTKAFSLTVYASGLQITTGAQLPSATAGTAFSQTMNAVGGTPPYTWSANGLPDGLTIDAASGLISGTPTKGGDFSFTVRVTDSVAGTSLGLFRMTVALPSLPPVQISGLPATVGPAEQHTLGLTLSSAYTTDLSGQLILSFAPESGGGDSTIQFSTGGTSASFTIPAGTTTATFSTPSLALQTGTVAGTLVVSVRLQSGGADITPAPAPSASTTIARAAPYVTSATLNRTSTGLEIQITGYCTSREVTQAVFTFTAAAGKTLVANQVTVQLADLFSQWFQNQSSSQYGSQFTYKQPFTIQGDATAVIPQTVVLTNRTGDSQTATIN